MKIRETIRCCSFFLRTHVKISSKISIIEFNIQIKWCIIVTPSREAEKDYQEYFNSPPHKKNHIATTMINAVLFKISTHILTKRMTKAIEKIPYFGLFQLTSSRRGWRFSKILALIAVHFNSHPHEEDDQVEMATRYMTLHFNSHPHEEDDPTFSSLSSSVSSFQLTSSRRGWLFLAWLLQALLYFNSHPHEEDD